MKKLLALLLAVLMVFSLVACGKDKDKDEDNDSGNGVKAAEKTAVEEYVEKNESLLVSMLESSIAGSDSGVTCTSSVEAVGNGIIVSINIDQLDNVDSTVKAQMQANCDMMKDQLGNIVTQMRTELPELEYLEYRICEKDGDFLASVTLR